MQRTFLFLQGNSSHFFRVLGKALAERGHTVRRINMSGGDWFFWGSWNAVDYKGKPEDFGEFVRGVINADAVTDIILHNDCRPGHRLAVQVARDLGCRIWVFEEGYLRPHWLTLEEGGINGNSPLTLDAAGHLRSANDNEVTEEDFVRLPSSMARRVMYDFEWQIWNYLLWFRYPRFRTHRPFPIWAEYATWVRRLAVLPLRKRHASTVVERLSSGREPFFVFPMQLDSDSQVSIHSPFDGMTAALDTIIANFARHAPAETRLVVKAHPLDNGWRNFRKRTAGLARRYGVASRVDFIDGGDLNVLVKLAQGVVTLNSTVGFIALSAGCPVICLGKAIFDLPNLTFQGNLSLFWREGRAPNRELLSGFLEHLRQESLVNGDYYTGQGIALAVGNAIARFENSGRRGVTPSNHPCDLGANRKTGADLPLSRQEAELPRGSL